MDTTEISHERIIEAAHALRHAGIGVTGPALREWLGSGDPDQLVLRWKDYLASSREEREAMLPAEIVDGITAGTLDLGQQITKLVGQLHTKAALHAERRVLQVARTLVDEREQAALKMSNAIRASTDLQDQLSALHAENERLGHRLAGLIGALRAQEQKYLESVAQLQEQLAALRQEAEGAQKRQAGELDRAQRTLERYRRELNEALAAAEWARARVGQEQPAVPLLTHSLSVRTAPTWASPATVKSRTGIILPPVHYAIVSYGGTGAALRIGSAK